jgi:hypothetical protein
MITFYSRLLYELSYTNFQKNAKHFITNKFCYSTKINSTIMFEATRIFT